MSVRGSGTTSRQLTTAPHGAVFVWLNARLDYPKCLALWLGREDITIVSPSWLESGRWRGRMSSDIILDHAASLTPNQWLEYTRAESRIRYDDGAEEAEQS